MLKQASGAGPEVSADYHGRSAIWSSEDRLPLIIPGNESAAAYPSSFVFLFLQISEFRELTGQRKLGLPIEIFDRKVFNRGVLRLKSVGTGKLRQK